MLETVLVFQQSGKHTAKPKMVFGLAMWATSCAQRECVGV